MVTTETLVDLYSPDTYARSMPHDAFAMLRKHEPVRRQPEPAGPGYWALTRYEDIVAVSSDNTLFSSERGGRTSRICPRTGCWRCWRRPWRPG